MTIILVTYYNLIIERQFYLSRWLKTLDIMLKKGIGLVVDKLCTIQIIKANLHFARDGLRMNGKLSIQNVNSMLDINKEKIN